MNGKLNLVFWYQNSGIPLLAELLTLNVSRDEALSMLPSLILQGLVREIYNQNLQPKFPALVSLQESNVNHLQGENRRPWKFSHGMPRG